MWDLTRGGRRGLRQIVRVIQVNVTDTIFEQYL